MSIVIGILAYLLLAFVAGVLLGNRLKDSYPTGSADSEPTPLSDYLEFSEGNNARTN